MDDPLVDYLFLAHENWEQHDGPTPDMFTMLAHAVRAYWREHRPTREEVGYHFLCAASLPHNRSLLPGGERWLDSADALLALFDRVWGERRHE